MHVFRSMVGAALLAVAVPLSACGGAHSGSADGRPSVVASTDVWGSVARAVTGDHADVKSIVNSATADPHSFEATPADVAAITDASLVVYNGGGYDHWIDDVLAGHGDLPTVNAFELAGDPHGNEHVFYDLDTAKAVATKIADQLAGSDSGNAQQYRAGAAEFSRQADGILQQERAIGQVHPDAAVVATEPVAHYLLATAGVADKTPKGFATAVEEGDDPSPADLGATLDLIKGHKVSALLFNPQTESAVTKQVRVAAEQARLPVITITETLPADTDYLTWQRQTVEALSSQLDKTAHPNP